MTFKDRLRKLKRRAKGETIVIPQEHGSHVEFLAHAGMDAFMNFIDRIGAGEDAPPEHPLITAAKNSSDPTWRHSFFSVNADITAPIADLSEPFAKGRGGLRRDL